MSSKSDARVDLKRIIGLSLVIGGALVFAFIASVIIYAELEPEASPYWWIGPSYSGVVQSVDPSRLTIVTDDGTAQSFRIDALTRIVLQGEVRLAAGARVRVKYKALRDDKVARGIRLLGPPIHPPATTGK